MRNRLNFIIRNQDRVTSLNYKCFLYYREYRFEYEDQICRQIVLIDGPDYQSARAWRWRIGVNAKLCLLKIKISKHDRHSLHFYVYEIKHLFRDRITFNWFKNKY